VRRKFFDVHAANGSAIAKEALDWIGALYGVEAAINGKGDVLCTANLGFTHAKPEEADRTVVCMKGFPVPK
jgi:hypothetical protein